LAVIQLKTIPKAEPKAQANLKQIDRMSRSGHKKGYFYCGENMPTELYVFLSR
jgi:hypothetical protein